MSDPLMEMRGRQIVLDTTTPIVYIGTLADVTGDCFVLTDCDMHDCRDGHASKEKYLVEVASDAVTPNRRRIVVTRTAVISVSCLEDVLTD